MKLATEIKPRKDGTVIAHVPATARGDGATVVFKPDSNGRLVANVDVDDHIGFLLDCGNFFPVDEVDIGDGLKFAATPVGGDEVGSGGVSSTGEVRATDRKPRKAKG